MRATNQNQNQTPTPATPTPSTHIPPDPDPYAARLTHLFARLRALPGATVAFSGGVDSTMLLHAARFALGASKVLAVTADSPSLPRSELEDTRALAALIGVRHLVVATHELEREGYNQNSPERCYFCKSELFDVVAAALQRVAERDWPVLYGAITDDASDHRPGARAARERNILAPLEEAGLSKEDVRRYSREHRLPTAEKPSFACLASRVQHGIAIDAPLLLRIETAEQYLRTRGFVQFRVRHHDTWARIEVDPSEIARAAGEEREGIVAHLKRLGYERVTLDLEGYRTGSMNPTTTTPDSATRPLTPDSATPNPPTRAV